MTWSGVDLSGPANGKLQPMSPVTLDKLRALPMGTEVAFIIVAPMGVAIQVGAFHINEETIEHYTEHEEALEDVAMGLFILPDNLVPDEVPADLARKDH